MQNVILITGATDGIGFETAKTLVALGHHVIAHGRNPSKVAAVVNQLNNIAGEGKAESVIADLSDLKTVTAMIEEIAQRFSKIDVLINNAGVFNAPQTITPDGLDIRFVVNTIAPYLLTTALLPLLPKTGRVINLSSAAQAPVNIEALDGRAGLTKTESSNKTGALSDSDAYAQSKLALTMWSRYLGQKYKPEGPVIVSVNPKSLLGSKMVKSAFGIAGGDLRLGADILVRATLSEEFVHAHGLYFDNDLERFTEPHGQALNDDKVKQVVNSIERLIRELT